MKSPNERVVVVTGASAGVGRAVVQAFARKKAWIGLIARGEERLKETQKEVERLGGCALILPCDVADYRKVEEAALQVEKEFGPIDLWINNAMVSMFAPFQEMTPEEFERVTKVTYLGVVNGTRAALKYMLPRNSGVIIEVGSTLAYRGIPLQSAYCGAKHAIEGFVDSLRSELLHQKSKVRVSMCQLPALNTPQFNWVKSTMPFRPQPVAPIFQPEVAAQSIVWLADHPRRELFVGFRTSLFIFGNKLIPSFGDWYLAKQGYSAQQTQEPENPTRPHNLWEPAPGRFDAHGRFDDISRSRSYYFWFNAYRRWILGGAVGLLLGLIVIFR